MSLRLSWWLWLRLLLVIASLIGAWFLPYVRLVQLQKYVPLTGVLILISLLIFGADLIRERPEIAERTSVKQLVSIVAMIAVIVSGLKGIFEVRTELFNPIREAKGMGSINFSELVSPTSFGSWYPLPPPIFIRTAITGGSVIARLSIKDITLTTRRKVIDGHETLEQASRITFTISSEPVTFPNGLENVSARTFTKDCNYLEVPVSIHSLPNDVTYDGIVYLTLNGNQYHEFIIPKAYPSKVPVVFVPLNEKARTKMMKYKIYNPKDGTLEHFKHLPEPTKGP
jgi:hypothetical protein